ncbi:DUF7674 family protein [Brumicola blandensis]|uniref:DUF7674 domain-containing protein n=1 Tax=Brumicola blandensis TaxID=3075611 RepID=A0AAW8QX90_9ALTE|nr:hypothetical protein [Alteromonas sp. W409]MDT0581711.1 hypothetical protein [Alteromonas sp. W409]
MSKVLCLVEELESMTPGFMKVWIEWLKEDEEFGDGEQPNEHTVFLEYNHFIVQKLDDLSSENKIILFGYIENALNSHDDNLSEAVATCFLESLVQKSGQYKPENCFPFLGPKSKAHSRAWDEFNGMKTKGLW